MRHKLCDDCQSGKTKAKQLVDAVFPDEGPTRRKSGRAPKSRPDAPNAPESSTETEPTKTAEKPRRIGPEAQTLDGEGGVLLESLTLKPNTVLGAYRIVELLGIGGIGQVYLADHIKLGRKVALKKLRREFTENPVVVRRFFDEARAANQISHENIVEITDFIEDEENGSYIIMELLRGRDLAQLIEESAPLPVKRTISILRQVADALAAAHRKGIVHRDLTPDNIFLTERRGQADFVKVLDFGIAKLTTEDDPAKAARTTAAGSVLGTPAYMSPEQCLGRSVDYRTDIYAFGVMLYEMLCGLLPFDAATPGEFVVQHTTATPHKLSDRMLDRTGLPLQLEALAMRCLAKEPDARPPSMDAIQDELEGLADANDISLQIYLPQSDPPSRISSPDSVDTLSVPASEVSSRRAPLIWGGLALIGLLVGGWLATRTEEAPAVAAAPTVERSTIAPAIPTEPEPVAEEATEVEATPESITIRFESDPPGAEVWREGADLPVGTTPVDQPFLRSDEDATFHYRLRGYDDLDQDVSLARDAISSVVLRPSRRAVGMRMMRQSTPSTPSMIEMIEMDAAGQRGRNSTNGRRAVLEF